MSVLKKALQSVRWHRHIDPPDAIEIFIDIDGTIAYPDNSGKHTMSFLGVPHSYAHGAIEFCVALSRIPCVYQLFFFSAGYEARNSSLCRKLAQEAKMKSGKKLEYKIFSRQHLNMNGQKDLRAVRPRVNLNRAILIDDQDRAVAPGQGRNFLRVFDGLQDLCEAHDFTLVEQSRIRNNLFRALGLLLLALDLALEQNAPLADMLFELQWKDDEYDNERTNTQAMYERGLKAMRAVTPDLDYYVIRDKDGSMVHPWDPDPEPVVIPTPAPEALSVCDALSASPQPEFEKLRTSITDGSALAV